MTYYTLRKAGPSDKPIFALAKWEDGETEPLDVYVQWIPQRGDGSYNVHSCNCPSRSNPCKHAAMSLALLEVGVDFLPYYMWDGEVTNCDDVTYESVTKLAQRFDY